MKAHTIVIAALALISAPSVQAAIILEVQPDKFQFEGPTDKVSYDGKAFLCDFKDAAYVSTDGMLQAERSFDWWKWDRSSSFLFESSTGVMTTQEKTEKWVVLRQASNHRDLLAHLPDADPLLNQLRIFTYTQPMRFWLTDGADVYSGTCNMATN